MGAQATRQPKSKHIRANGGRFRQVVQNWQLFLLLLPGLAYVLIFAYGPMYGLQIAFRNFQGNLGIWGSNWVGFEHFIRFFRHPQFWMLIRNTSFLSLYALCTFPLGVLFALMLNELNKIKFKKTVQMLTYAPHFISTVVVCSMIMLFFNKSYGLVNNVLALLGMERADILTEAKYFRSIYVWSGVWSNLGWNTIIYMAALAGVSDEHVEAAIVDGASRFQIVRHIKIPAIMPTIMIMLILSCGSILSVGFEKVFLLQNALNLGVSQVLSTYVYSVGLVGGQYSFSAAVDLFNTAINVIFVITVNLIVKKITEVSLW